MHNNNKMKVSELQEIIRAAIKEVVNEADISPAEKAAKDAELNAINKKIAALNIKKGDLASGREEITEDNIDELANVAVRYELAPGVSAADFAGKKNRIITAMQSTEEPMSKIDVAGELGYNKQNPINADFMELVANGTIVQSGGQAAPRLNRPTAEPAAGEQPTDDEFDFIKGDMTDDEIDASFAAAKASGEEEPEIGDVEKSGVSAAKMSDADYEAFMKVTDLENRLAATKSNILKLKRSKGSAGDIGDKPSDELQRLRDLKISLEKRIADAIASSKYLQQRQEKATGEPYEPTVDDTEEEPIDEWTKGQMQYYAGIKK